MATTDMMELIQTAREFAGSLEEETERILSNATTAEGFAQIGQAETAELQKLQRTIETTNAAVRRLLAGRVGPASEVKYAVQMGDVYWVGGMQWTRSKPKALRMTETGAIAAARGWDHAKAVELGR